MSEAVELLQALVRIPSVSGEEQAASDEAPAESAVGAFDSSRVPRFWRDEDSGVLWVLAANKRARDFYVAGGWTPDGGTREEPVNGEPVAQLRYTRALDR